MRHVIRYGKHNISFYRTHPTRGLLAGRVNIDVFGDNFRCEICAWVRCSSL